MKKRALCWLLVLVMVASLLPTFAAAAGTATVVDTKSVEKDKLHLDKTLSVNDDGTYSITLESYAKGVTSTIEVKEPVPTDFVLVLDQSGSMTEVDMPTGFTADSRTTWTANQANGKYYKAPDGNYYQVHINTHYQYSMKAANTYNIRDLTTYDNWFAFEIGGSDDGETEAEVYYLYNGVYYRLRVYSEGLAGRYHATLYFNDGDGVRHNLGTYTHTSVFINPEVNIPLYVKSGSATYSLYYTNAEGVNIDITDLCGISPYPSSANSGTAYTGTLYNKGENESRLNALKGAVGTFVSEVASQKNADGTRVDHRIAIVGFASGNKSGEYGYIRGENTEVFDGSTQQNYFDGLSQTQYRNALKNTDAAGLADLELSRQALDASGATQVKYGFEMAKAILDSRSTADQYYEDANHQQQKRNTVVVLFTDGRPGTYTESDQYAAANEAISRAHELKPDTTIFTVGVFSESDSAPLTYTDTSSDNAQSSPYYVYHQRIDGTTYYFYRKCAIGTANPNDTVKDYMQLVSSDYLDATAMYGSNNTTSVRGDKQQDKEFYFSVRNSEGLENAFSSIATSVDQTTTPVTAGTSSEFTDVINTADFEIPSTASAKAYWVELSTTDDANYTPGTTKHEERSVPITNGQVTVDGFDYSTYYTAIGHSGRKLVVEITGLIPKHDGEILSNSGTAIKPDVEDHPDVVALELTDSPKDNITAQPVVVDFNAKMKVASDTKQLKNVDASNGAFTKSADTAPYDVYYQLDTAKQTDAKGTTVTINEPYDSVDTAMVFGKFLTTEWVNGESVTTTDAKASWKTVTAIPASSIYFDDNLTGTTVNVGDGSGYNAQISASPAEGNAEKGIYTFTFYGTGIDVYCTTDTTGGYVSAKLTQNGQAVAGQPNQTIRNYDKEVTRYNVPSISFTGLDYGTYVVTLNVLSSSNYKLDGIRVYGAVNDQTQYTGTHEQYAAYINMREALVNDNGVDKAFTNEMEEEDFGVLFVDDSSKLIEERQQYDAQTHLPIVDESGNPVYGPAYKNLFEAYQANSPKHEIYLDSTKQQEILFKLTADGVRAAANGNLWIGLSAPDKNKNTGTVTLKEGKTIDVTSGVDMYYPITSDMIGDNGVVTIKNTGSSMISVTNLKITGNETIYNAVQAAQPANSEDAAPASLADAMPLVFEQLTMQAVKIAANNGVDPDAPADPGTGEPDDPGTPDQPDDPGADKPTWTDPMSLLKTLFQALLNTLGNLFKGLGGW